MSVYLTCREAAARFPATLLGVPVVVRDSGGPLRVQRTTEAGQEPPRA